MLLMDKRRNLILDKLYSDGTVYVSDLADEYSVSYETIRKDLAFLERKGLLVKSHGGATLKQGALENPFHIREKENYKYKKNIAQRALDLIPENSTIIIGTGSTTLELAILLSKKNGYKIFTDSLPVATLLINSNNQIFMFGGELRKKSSSVFGGWVVSQIKQINVDICFLGTDGFANMSGASSPSSSDTFIDQTIIEHSNKSYILGDYTKFDRKSLYQICDWKSVTALVTNKEANPKKLQLVQKSTQVITC